MHVERAEAFDCRLYHVRHLLRLCDIRTKRHNFTAAAKATGVFDQRFCRFA
jgi:hypothetical protein